MLMLATMLMMMQCAGCVLLVTWAMIMIFIFCSGSHSDTVGCHEKCLTLALMQTLGVDWFCPGYAAATSSPGSVVRDANYVPLFFGPYFEAEC